MQLYIEYLLALVKNLSEFRHGLAKSYIFLNDRQNFASCIKICNDDLIKALSDVHYSDGMILYFYLFRLIIITYIDKEITPFYRLYQAKLSAFLCR